jgi:hypothetical protein
LLFVVFWNAVRIRRVLLLLLGCVAFLLAGAIAPHLHEGHESAWWNADHDLTLMATFGTHACQPSAMPVVALALAIAAALTLVGPSPGSAPLRRSAPRGPPLR